MTERKPKCIEDVLDKWRIVFDTDGGSLGDSDSMVTITFVKKGHSLVNKEDLDELEKDIRDLGKIREYKKARERLGLFKE